MQRKVENGWIDLPAVFAVTVIPVRGEGRVPVSLTDCHFHFLPVSSCSIHKNMYNQLTSALLQYPRKVHKKKFYFLLKWC